MQFNGKVSFLKTHLVEFPESLADHKMIFCYQGKTLLCILRSQGSKPSVVDRKRCNSVSKQCKRRKLELLTKKKRCKFECPCVTF